MRGISSMAKAVTPASAMALSAASLWLTTRGRWSCVSARRGETEGKEGDHDHHGARQLGAGGEAMRRHDRGEHEKAERDQPVPGGAPDRQSDHDAGDVAASHIGE